MRLSKQPFLRLVMALTALVVVNSGPTIGISYARGTACGDDVWDETPVLLTECPGTATLAHMDETCALLASEYTAEFCTVCADISQPSEVCEDNPDYPVPDPNNPFVFDWTVCYGTHEEVCRPM
jgi:hypothetical protein